MGVAQAQKKSSTPSFQFDDKFFLATSICPGISLGGASLESQVKEIHEWVKGDNNEIHKLHKVELRKEGYSEDMAEKMVNGLRAVLSNQSDDRMIHLSLFLDKEGAGLNAGEKILSIIISLGGDVKKMGIDLSQLSREGKINPSQMRTVIVSIDRIRLADKQLRENQENPKRGEGTADEFYITAHDSGSQKAKNFLDEKGLGSVWKNAEIASIQRYQPIFANLPFRDPAFALSLIPSLVQDLVQDAKTMQMQEQQKKNSELYAKLLDEYWEKLHRPKESGETEIKNT